MKNGKHCDAFFYNCLNGGKNRLKRANFEKVDVSKKAGSLKFCQRREDFAVFLYFRFGTGFF